MREFQSMIAADTIENNKLGPTKKERHIFKISMSCIYPSTSGFGSQGR